MAHHVRALVSLLNASRLWNPMPHSNHRDLAPASQPSGSAPSDAIPRSSLPPSDASKVVVVEHDPEMQSRLARSLTVSGARVVGTSSPQAALTLMDHWSPDLVVVDEALPGEGGLELARRIREEHPTSRVVLMTASDDPRLRASALVAGVLLLLVKPFPFEALLDIVASLTPGE